MKIKVQFIKVWNFNSNFSWTNYGSIQEDRNKMDQSHFLWNRPTLCGTVPQFLEQRLKNVEQLLKKWTRSCKQVSVPQIVDQRAKLNILNILGAL